MKRPYKDLPKYLVDNQKVKVYNKIIEEIKSVPKHEYFLATIFANIGYKDDYEVKTDYCLEPHKLPYIRGNYEYAIRQTVKLSKKYKNEECIDTERAILTNLCILGIYENEHRVTIARDNLCVPDKLWDKYKHFSNISTNYNSPIAMYEHLNLLNGKSRYEYFAETEEALLKAKILNNYGKIIYPDLIEEPIINQNNRAQQAVKEDNGDQQPEEDNNGGDGEPNKNKLGFQTEEYETFIFDNGEKIKFDDKPQLRKAYKKLIIRIKENDKQDHFKSGWAKEQLDEIDNDDNISYQGQSFSKYFTTQQSKDYRPIFKKLFNQKGRSHKYKLNTDYIP